MEEKKNLVRNKKQMFIIIGAFILTLLLGTVTYAFFNYTRTGSNNTIRTGRIAFDSEQGTAINLTDMFPIDTTVNGIMDDNTKVGSVTINVTGDTNYSEGIEYLVSAVGVTNTVGSGQNQKILPISISVSVANNTENDPATNLGTADESYFTNRGGSSSIYKVLATDTITNNEELVVGYIAPGATGVDGNIVIKAYLDKTKVAISDTYPEEETDTNNDGYIDGTPSSFGEGKTVLTTDEWNSLQTNGVSFQVKVESQEGTWVTAPPKTATFDVGSVVNTKMKLLKENGEYTGQNLSETRVYSLHSFQRSDNKPDVSGFGSVNVLSSNSSEVPIYAWSEENGNSVNIMWYTDADVVYLNEDCSNMFRDFEYITADSGLDEVDVSHVTNMSAMFRESTWGVDFRVIRNWDVSNVTNMSRMFYYVFNDQNDSFAKDASPLNNWDVSNVQSFEEMFLITEECGSVSDFTYPDFSAHKPNYHWDNSEGEIIYGFQSYKGSYIPN